jgi:hypothetical protein
MSFSSSPISGSADSPPPEVLDAIGVAADAWQRLTGSGHSLRFTPQGRGRVSVQVIDSSGATVGTLSASQALAVAAGDALP